MNKEDKNTVNNKLFRILTNGKDGKDLFHLYSYYIASNPDFKYNPTYLTDLIDDFFSDLEFYRKKIKVFIKVLNHIKGKVKKHFTITAIFDSAFQYEISNGEYKRIENVAETDFSFHKLNKENFTIGLKCTQEDDSEPKDLLEYAYEIKIKPYGEENYTLKKWLEECESAWKKNIDDYIDTVNKYEEKKE